MEEKAIASIAAEVGMARREAEIKLDEVDFGEAKEINKRKRLILEGRDPDSEKATEKGKREKKMENKQKFRPKNIIKDKKNNTKAAK